MRKRSRNKVDRNRTGKTSLSSPRSLSIEMLESRLTPAFSPTIINLEGFSGPTLQGGFVAAELTSLPWGKSTASIGDFNGDGYDDFIVGTEDEFHGSNPDPARIGRSFVRFGSPTDDGYYTVRHRPDLAEYAGFEIVGVDVEDKANFVGGGGDINGDGYDDIIIGATGVDRWVSSGTLLVKRESVGAAYVIFGRPQPYSAPLQLSSLNGTNGFRFLGTNTNDFVGYSVDIVGDVNADGYDDIAIGAPYYDRVTPIGSTLQDTGAAFVIFGKASGFAATMTESDLDGTNGFTILGQNVSDYTGSVVRGAGDVNGDGRADIIIGSENRDILAGSILTDVGGAEVIFGRSSGYPPVLVTTSLDGTNGFRFSLGIAGEQWGYDVDGAGDFNNDGIGDLIISKRGTALANSDYDAAILLGRTSGFQADRFYSGPTNGLILFRNISPNKSLFRISSGGIGDVDGDGVDDIAIGNLRFWKQSQFNPEADDWGGVVFLGSAFGVPEVVEYSTFSTTSITPSSMLGFKFQGSGIANDVADVVTSLGDFNGDGFNDFLVGSSRYEAQLNKQLGLASGILGREFISKALIVGTSGNDTLLGTSGFDYYAAGLGNDFIRSIGDSLGRGDAANGGAGDDRFEVTKLTFNRIDGGSGYDTITLPLSNMTLDLTAISNSRIKSIEAIELTLPSQSLVVSRTEVLAISDKTHTLDVRRNNPDSVINMGRGWEFQGWQVSRGVTYQVYTNGKATLRIEELEITASVTGPTSVVRNEPATFILTATGAGPFSFGIDWDGNGVFDQTVVGPSGTSVTYAFPNSGTTFPQIGLRTVKVRATDAGGLFSPWSNLLSVQVKPFEVRPSTNTTTPGLTDLIVGGTSGTDAYYFTGFPTSGIFWFVLAENFGFAAGQNPNGIFGSIDNNGALQGNYLTRTLPAFTGKLIVFAGASYNYISAELLFGAAILNGGINDDVLIGSTYGDVLIGNEGNDILRGGSGFIDGNDTILGGAGDDILIGHLGADVLFGGAGSDILIAGSINWPGTYVPSRLVEIQTEWLTTRRTYTQKVQNLLGTGTGPRLNANTFLQAGITVIDDTSADLVFGEADLDFFFADTPEDTRDAIAGEMFIEL